MDYTPAICPACGDPCQLLPLPRIGYRLADANGESHGEMCPELVSAPHGRYQRRVKVAA
jgi:hypothetical protein